MRKSLDPVALFRRIEAEPWRYDFFQALRMIECAHPDRPRLGHARRPQDEPVRLAQTPSLAFAPATISSLSTANPHTPPRLSQQFFGLLGPNGPLPLHLTEFARERQLHHRDESFVRFLDVIHHRLLLHFYRAWAQGQPNVGLDRPRADRFSMYVGSLVGIGEPALRQRDAAGDHVRLFFAGLLSRQVRNVDGLRSMLAGFFRLPVRIIEFAGHWMRLPEDDLSRLGTRRQGARLGQGAVLGARIWDRQHRIQLAFGPLSHAQYESLLPGGKALEQLVALMRHYLGFQLDWDLRLSLDRNAVPAARLGTNSRLGWTSWLGSRSRADDADDLVLNVEQVVGRQTA